MVFSTDDPVPEQRQGLVFSTDDPLPEEEEKKDGYKRTIRSHYAPNLTAQTTMIVTNTFKQ